MNTLTWEAACCHGASGLNKSIKSTARWRGVLTGAAGGANQISCGTAADERNVADMMPIATCSARISRLIVIPGLLDPSRLSGQYIARHWARKEGTENALSRAQPNHPSHQNKVRRSREERKERDRRPIAEGESAGNRRVDCRPYQGGAQGARSVDRRLRDHGAPQA